MQLFSPRELCNSSCGRWIWQVVDRNNFDSVITSQLNQKSETAIYQLRVQTCATFSHSRVAGLILRCKLQCQLPVHATSGWIVSKVCHLTHVTSTAVVRFVSPTPSQE